MGLFDDFSHWWHEPKPPKGPSEVRFGCKGPGVRRKAVAYYQPRLTKMGTVSLPTRYDPRKKLPPAWNQGPIGSCVAQAWAFLARQARVERGLEAIVPDRLLSYYECRVRTGTVQEDSGAYILDALELGNSVGTCRERIWPYRPERFREKPPVKAYEKAQKHPDFEFRCIAGNDDEAIKNSLCNDMPVIFGAAVFQGRMHWNPGSGRYSYEELTAGPIVGHHCEVIVGYDDAPTDAFAKFEPEYIVRGSWSGSYGERGCVRLPQRFIHNHGYDLFNLEIA